MPQPLNFQDAARLFSDDVNEEIAPVVSDIPHDLDPVDSLADFIRYVFGLEPAAHHLEWIAALEDEQNYPRLLIVAPPGHAKTTVAGIAYPAWKIAKNPAMHFLYYGNTQTQADKQSTAIRDLMLTPKVQRLFPAVKRSRKGWAGNQWFLEREEVWDKDATMLSLGVDGPALGARADEFAFDDVADPQNMSTVAQRRKVRDQVAAVAFSRQGGKSRGARRMVAIHTRWHEEDLTNFFEDEGFKTIWMPAEGYWDVVKPNMRPGFRMSDLALPEWRELCAQLDGKRPLWEAEYDAAYFASYKRPELHDIWSLQFQGLTIRPGGNIFSVEQFKGFSTYG